MQNDITQEDDKKYAAAIAAVYAILESESRLNKTKIKSQDKICDLDNYFIRPGASLWGLNSRLRTNSNICSTANTLNKVWHKKYMKYLKCCYVFFCLILYSIFCDLSVYAQDNKILSQNIKVALLNQAKSVEVYLPSGAQILSEKDKELIAELPPQSFWKIEIGENQDQSGAQLLFDGQNSNISAKRVLLKNFEKSNYLNAASKAPFVDISGNKFSEAPNIIEQDRPKFILPFKELTDAYFRQSKLDKKKNITNSIQTVSFENKSLSNDQNLFPETINPNQGISKANTEVKVTKIKSGFIPGYIIKTNGTNAVANISGKTFRGTFYIRPEFNNEDNKVNRLIVINDIDIEKYLFSVLASEMPASWPLEALKAQAIAARTYAVANLGKHAKEGYDLKGNTEDQVYLGVQVETDKSNEAVCATSGLVLKHNEKVISAFFHSSSGGTTSLPEHTWSSLTLDKSKNITSTPYLQSVVDFDDKSPHFSWKRSIAVSDLEENLRQSGKDLGAILGILPLMRSPNQKLMSVMLFGSLQTLILSGEELRKLAKLPSSTFNLKEATDAYLFAGRGFGHGLGMSQWGAKTLSEQGYNAAQILSYYYKDINIDTYIDNHAGNHI